MHERFDLPTCSSHPRSSLWGREFCVEAGGPSASRLRARRNYNLHFSPRQRARTCSRIHQLAICALQLPQLGILIRSDTHMFGECLEPQICVSALILCVCICSRSTWPGPWQTLDQREVLISIRGQLYSSTPAAHHSPLSVYASQHQ